MDEPGSARCAVCGLGPVGRAESLAGTVWFGWAGGRTAKRSSRRIRRRRYPGLARRRSERLPCAGQVPDFGRACECDREVPARSGYSRPAASRSRRSGPAFQRPTAYARTARCLRAGRGGRTRTATPARRRRRGLPSDGNSERLVSSVEKAVAQGHYARKQLFCRDAIVAWSHQSRFKTARRLVEPYAGGRLLDYGSGDGTFLAMVHDLFPRMVGADDPGQAGDCRKRFAGLTGLSFEALADVKDRAYDGAFDVVTCMEVLEHCV